MQCLKVLFNTDKRTDRYANQLSCKAMFLNGLLDRARETLEALQLLRHRGEQLAQLLSGGLDLLFLSFTRVFAEREAEAFLVKVG